MIAVSAVGLLLIALASLAVGALIATVGPRIHVHCRHRSPE